MCHRELSPLLVDILHNSLDVQTEIKRITVFLTAIQYECGNAALLTCLTGCHFNQDTLEISIYLSWDNSVYHFQLSICTNMLCVKKEWILISWLLQIIHPILQRIEASWSGSTLFSIVYTWFHTVLKRVYTRKLFKHGKGRAELIVHNDLFFGTSKTFIGQEQW